MQDFEYITPSLLAFYIRDHVHLLKRLEYLVSRGEGLQMRLREVFKVSDKTFARRHPQFRTWSRLVQRRQEELEGASAARAAGVTGGGGAP
jgi:hypothetical protein